MAKSNSQYFTAAIVILAALHTLLVTIAVSPFSQLLELYVYSYCIAWERGYLLQTKIAMVECMQSDNNCGEGTGPRLGQPS